MGLHRKPQDSKDRPQPVKPAPGETKSNPPDVTGWLKSKELQPPT